MFDDWQSALWTVGFILGAYGIVVWLAIIVWTYRDMRQRTRDGWSQGVAVLLGALHVPGLFLYLILRPHETLTEAYERRLEAEALMRDLPEQRPSCPTCQRSANEDFILCPYCRARLRQPCSACGRALELSWTACPYCGVYEPQTAEPAAAPMAAGPPPPSTAQSAPRAEPHSAEVAAPAAPAANPTPPSPQAGSSP